MQKGILFTSNVDKIDHHQQSHQGKYPKFKAEHLVHDKWRQKTSKVLKTPMMKRGKTFFRLIYSHRYKLGTQHVISNARKQKENHVKFIYTIDHKTIQVNFKSDKMRNISADQSRLPKYMTNTQTTSFHYPLTHAYVQRSLMYSFKELNFKMYYSILSHHSGLVTKYTKLVASRGFVFQLGKTCTPI